jgi:hypothetical protein
MSKHVAIPSQDMEMIGGSSAVETSALTLIAQRAGDLCPIPEALVQAGVFARAGGPQARLDAAYEKTQAAYSGAVTALETLLALLDLDEAPPAHGAPLRFTDPKLTQIERGRS